MLDFSSNNDNETNSLPQRESCLSRSVRLSEQYNPEIGHSYSQLEVYRNIVVQRIDPKNTLRYIIDEVAMVTDTIIEIKTCCFPRSPI